MLNVLILGGSSEATALVHALKDRIEIRPILSLAGRTSTPVAQPVATRIGGFGGVEGLCAYLRAERIDLLVDATHPFAAQMSRHAREAEDRTHIPLVVLGRPAWQPRPGDRWTEVVDMAAAVVALGRAPRRVFLTVGRLQLAAFEAAPQHAYLARTIDPVSTEIRLPELHVIAARGPFDTDAEQDLMRAHRIDVLVTKNSGGTASAAKLDAARRLGLPVILVRRPIGSVDSRPPSGEGLGMGLAPASTIGGTARPLPAKGRGHNGSIEAVIPGQPLSVEDALAMIDALGRTLDHLGQNHRIGVAPAGP